MYKTGANTHRHIYLLIAFFFFFRSSLTSLIKAIEQLSRNQWVTSNDRMALTQQKRNGLKSTTTTKNKRAQR